MVPYFVEPLIHGVNMSAPLTPLGIRLKSGRRRTRRDVPNWALRQLATLGSKDLAEEEGRKEKRKDECVEAERREEKGGGGKDDEYKKEDEKENDDSLSSPAAAPGITGAKKETEKGEVAEEEEADANERGMEEKEKGEEENERIGEKEGHEEIVEREVEKEVEREVEKGVEREVEKEIERQVDEEIEKKAKEEMEKEQNEEIDTQVDEEIEKEAKEEIEKEVENEIVKEEETELERQKRKEEIEQDVEEEIKSEEEKEIEKDEEEKEEIEKADDEELEKEEDEEIQKEEEREREKEEEGEGDISNAAEGDNSEEKEEEKADVSAAAEVEAEAEGDDVEMDDAEADLEDTRRPGPTLELISAEDLKRAIRLMKESNKPDLWIANFLNVSVEYVLGIIDDEEELRREQEKDLLSDINIDVLETNAGSLSHILEADDSLPPIISVTLPKRKLKVKLDRPPSGSKIDRCREKILPFVGEKVFRDTLTKGLDERDFRSAMQQRFEWVKKKSADKAPLYACYPKIVLTPEEATRLVNSYKKILESTLSEKNQGLRRPQVKTEKEKETSGQLHHPRKDKQIRDPNSKLKRPKREREEANDGSGPPQEEKPKKKRATGTRGAQDQNPMTTRIKVKSNPKRPGSAAWERYNLYQHATTKQEYFDLGNGGGDWKFDLAKGFIEILE